MEISVYGIHHIVARYLTLRRYVYVVSDWMVFLCSFVCCQCAAYTARDSPVESLSDSSFIPYQISPRIVEVDTGRACGDPCKSQELVIDIHHFDHATDEDNKLKSADSLDLDSHRRDLDGIIAIPDKHLETPLTEIMDKPAPMEEPPVANKRNDDYPTVHNQKKIHEQQSVVAELTI